jgi:hypothetical protein
MSNAIQWGLPPEFVPVRYAIPDEAKHLVRDLLQPNEPVIISIGNEGDTVSLVATPYRVMVVKTASLGAGASGGSVREFPYEGIERIVMRPQSINLTLALHYRTSNGRTVEVGRRARLAKPAVDNLMAFELVAGQEVYEALLSIWEFKREQQASE